MRWIKKESADSKKKRGAEAPLLKTSVLFLVSQRFGGRRVGTRHATVVDHEGQITHCQVTCTDVADESETVSELEVAEGHHVAGEARSRGGGQRGVDRAGRD